jgi:predicted metal-dependent hydrolase
MSLPPLSTAPPERIRDGVVGSTTDEAWTWPLPREPHLPGRNPRPNDANINRIVRSAPRPTDPKAWAKNEAYRAGLRLYSHGYYWEAHEVWEPVWMHALPKSQEREMTQGLIQLANAALKLKMAQPAAARRLAAIAEGHFREAALGAAAVVMGVRLDALIEACGGFVDDLRRGREGQAPTIPLTGEA